MQRRISKLASERYDLVVVGGGIFGLCVAWDGVLRGLRVALLERRDFGHAASANCFKIVHGGIRYLQHADLVRVRQSSRERAAWLRIAPHQVKPLPILMPTYGHGARGKELLAAGFKAYDALTLDRNRGIPDAERRVPGCRLASKHEALEMFPGLDPRGLTGGAIFHDGRMESPARLALCVLLAAGAHGLEAANHAEVDAFLVEHGRVLGVRARDVLSGEVFEVRADVVLNAAGGWAPDLLRRGLGRPLQPPPTFSRDACFVARRRLSGDCALAVSARTRDPDALLSREARHLFLVPWRDHTLVGVWHVVHEGDPDRTEVTPEQLREFLDEANAAYPALELGPQDVALTQGGRVLFGENREGAVDLRYGKRSRLVEHAAEAGPEGLITLIGVRYTTARADAERAVDLVFRKLARRSPRCRTQHTPLYGGAVERFSALERAVLAERPHGLREDSLRALLRGHGDAFRAVLESPPGRSPAHATLPGSHVLAREVSHAVRQEMALALDDVVFRRTELGGTGHPGEAALRAAADCMAAELGWDTARRDRELDAVRAAFPTPAPAEVHRHAAGAAPESAAS